MAQSDLDLIGHYQLKGTDADSSGQENHALAFGEYTFDRNGNPESALKLRGDGDYILFPPIITLSEPAWTYSLWLRADALASEVSDMFLLSLSDVQEWQDINLYIDDTGNDFKIWYESDFWKVSTGVVPELGEWYHLAMCYHADDSVKVYINGELKLARVIDFISTGEASFILSSMIEFPDDPLKGRFFGVVDDIRIYGRALDGDEIRTLHDPLWDYVPEPEYVNLHQSLLQRQDPLRFFTNTFINRVSMYDIQGREVLRVHPMATDEVFIKMPPLASGMYAVHAHSSRQVYREKVVVVK